MDYIFYFAFGAIITNFIVVLWTFQMLGEDHIATDRTAYYYFLFFVALSNMVAIVSLLLFIAQKIY